MQAVTKSALVAAVAALLVLGAVPSTATAADMPPDRTIGGATADVGQVRGLAVDPGGAIYAADHNGAARIQVWAAGANGNVAPFRVISGVNTTLALPERLALDSSGNIYVASNGNNRVAVFSAAANGDVAPIRAITGLAGQPLAVALDASERVYVAMNNSTIAVFAAGADGAAVPLRTIAGAATMLNWPTGISIAPNGDIVVMNFNNAAVTVYSGTADGNVAPLRTLDVSPDASSAYDVKVNSQGEIYVAGYLSGSIFVYAPGATGTAAPIDAVAGALTGINGPFSIALGPLGDLHVANYDAATITVYAAGPIITGISPATGHEGTAVTISGVNFAGGSTVAFDGVPGTSVVVVNSTTITAIVPAHALGAVDVAVVGPVRETLRTAGFTYVAALAATGADASPLLLGSALLGVLGLGAVLFARSRRATSA